LEAGKLLAAGKVDDIMGTLQGERRITVRLLRNGEKAAEWLQNEDSVAALDYVDGSPAKLKFAFAGDLDALALLSERLATSEYGLVGFEEQKTDLEDLFLKVTKGIVR
jgi:ABC-2 type transport system ATP-binding protein